MRGTKSYGIVIDVEENGDARWTLFHRQAGRKVTIWDQADLPVGIGYHTSAGWCGELYAAVLEAMERQTSN